MTREEEARRQKEGLASYISASSFDAHDKKKILPRRKEEVT